MNETLNSRLLGLANSRRDFLAYASCGAAAAMLPGRSLAQEAVPPAGSVAGLVPGTLIDLTTSSTAVTKTGKVTVITPAAMSGIVEFPGSYQFGWAIAKGSSLVVDTGTSMETVSVTTVTATTFSAVFTHTHTATPWTIAIAAPATQIQPWIADVVADYGADPTGVADSTAAFQTALTYLAGSTAVGAVLNVPPGNYSLSGTLSYTGGPISIVGAGADISVLNFTGAGAGATALSLSAPPISTDNNSRPTLTVRDIGFATTAAGFGTALSIATPIVPADTQATVVVRNIDFRGSSAGYFATGLLLNGPVSSVIRGCHYTGSGSGSNLLGTFLVMTATAATGAEGCVDNKIEDCSIDTALYGILLQGNVQHQGLHIINCTVTNTICGLATGTTNLVANSTINLLQLVMTGCDFQCSGLALYLVLVDSGWLEDCNFSSAGAVFGVTIGMSGCSFLQFSNCQVSNSTIASSGVVSPTSGVAINVWTNASGNTAATLAQGSGNNVFNNVTFRNIAVGINLGASLTSPPAGSGFWVVSGNSGREMRLFTPNGYLVGNPITSANAASYGVTLTNGAVIEAVIDNSGDNGNYFEWVSEASGGLNTTSDRLLYSQP